MVKQEIYKINDFFTLAGWRRPIYLNKFGRACWAAPKREKQTDNNKKKSLQFTPNVWHFRGNDTKTIARCPPESFTKKKSAADSQIAETGEGLARERFAEATNLLFIEWRQAMWNLCGQTLNLNYLSPEIWPPVCVGG